MEQVTSKIVCNIQELAPHERLKYIRKKLLGINQEEFCSNGNFSLNTLKHVESGRVAISEKNAEKLIYQLQIFGVYCNSDIFQDHPSRINIDIDYKFKEDNFSLTDDISRFNEKIKKLKAIKINENIYEPFIKKDSIVFIDVNKSITPESLNETLCLIEASTTKIFFLTYKDNQVIAEFKEEKMVFSLDTLKMCKVYPIDVVFYG